MNRAERRRLLKQGVSRAKIALQSKIDRQVQDVTVQKAVEATLRTTTQFVGDCAKLVLNREFGFGPDRLARFHRALDEDLAAWQSVISSPGAGDLTSEVGYLRTRFDTELRRVLGSNFTADFEARYPWVDDEVI